MRAPKNSAMWCASWIGWGGAWPGFLQSGGELGSELDERRAVNLARMRQRHRELARDATRTRRHKEHAVAEAGGRVRVMRDKHDRLGVGAARATADRATCQHPTTLRANRNRRGASADFRSAESRSVGCRIASAEGTGPVVPASGPAERCFASRAEAFAPA